jgi:hypothetical protein
MPGELTDTKIRLASSRRSRSDRYREQADRFEHMAEMETRPSVRSRLFDLARQYLGLADCEDRENPQEPEGLSPGREHGRTKR